MIKVQDLLKYEESIRKEADSILFDGGLKDLISRYGRVEMAGSYPLKMMYKKDLDITLVAPTLQPQKFFELGGKIAEHLNSYFLYYHNTRIKELPRRPVNSLYFGISFNDWKIDLWVTSEEWWSESKQYMNNILEKLTDEKKKVILEIKKEFSNSSDYGRKFNSNNVYSAVLDNHVNSVTEFKNFLNL